MAKVARNQVSGEDFAAKYVELYNAGFDATTGESTATIAQVAEYFGMTTANAYQKVRNLNKELKDAGFDGQLPKMKMNAESRVPKLDLSKIAELAAAAKARQALDLLD
jgi:hypothetical protein